MEANKKSEILGSLKVLVVEDSRSMSRVVVAYLESLGVNYIKEFEDAESALEELRSRVDTEKHYNVVFLDWLLPGMDGLELLKICRNDTRFKEMAIVMLTSKRQEKNVMETGAAGATYYIAKPFSPRDIADGLDNILAWFEIYGTIIIKSDKENDSA